MCVQYQVGDMSFSFHGNRIQWNFLRQRAASICESFLTFQELNPSIFFMKLVPKTLENLHILTRLPKKISLNHVCDLQMLNLISNI
jgi:hypothetical protein